MKTINKNMLFVRWGDMNQKATNRTNIQTDDFHKPPCKFGIYAFPEIAIESYLVNWKYCKQIDEKIAKSINKEEYNYDNYYKILKLKKFRELKRIKYKGNVWHHFLDLSKSSVRTKYWALDTFEDYLKYLNKAIQKDFFYTYNICDEYGRKTIHNHISYFHKYTSKDDYEVYLPEKIK